MSLKEECIEYLRQPGFQRFIDAWTQKYKTLGHLGGKIILENLSSQEKEVLGLFLGLDLSKGILQITYNQFMKQFHTTKFENIDFLDMLKSLQEKPLYTKQQIKDKKHSDEEIFKESLLNKYNQSIAYDWLKAYLYEDRLVHKNIHTQKEQYFQILSYICESLNHLPIYQNKYILLPVFSQQITLDPHFFDNDFNKELLLKGIQHVLNIELQNKSIESINDIFYQAGLLKDDLSNNCYICHIKPMEYQSGWQGFYDNYEPWNMNLYNLMQVDSLFSKKKIYIVENPSVFRSLVYCIKENNIDVGLICSNGQINLCTYMLLDKLVESHCTLYYAGDYDPEGLLIADKLKLRYQNHLSLWVYDSQYFHSIKILQTNISLKRLNILDNIRDENLKKISKDIVETYSFGYQEGLISLYIDDLKNNMY